MKDKYQKSLSIVNRLVRKSIYNNAQVVAMYESTEEEVNTTFILKNHILSEEKELKIINNSTKDITADIYIVPASKFDFEGNIVSRIEFINSKKVFSFSFEENKVDKVSGTQKSKVLTEECGYNV